MIPRRYGPDLAKILDTVKAAEDHHKARDEANAALHLAPMRMSPLTARLEAERERLERLVGVVQGDEA